MRAAVLETQGNPLVLREDVDIAPPKAGQVRVRIKHCGVCHSDLSLVDGSFPSLLPIILGHEASGVVEEVGPGTSGLTPGDHVVLTPCPPCGTCYWCARGEASLCVAANGITTSAFPDGTTGLSRNGEVIYRGVNLGGFAESVVTQTTGAIKIPNDIPLEVACVIGCAIQTGVGAVLNTAQVEEGATVLVMGLGGVGLSAVQGARIAGAARIVASDPVAERREAARALGATDVIDPTSEDVTARAREITEVGFDYAFETAGRAALIDTALAAVRNGGTVVCVGAPPLTETVTLLPSVFVITGKRILASVLGSSNSVREIPRMLGLWRAGRLDLEALITARRPLADINHAMEDLRHSRGIRTVLNV